MYIYIYICMYVYIYIYVCIHMYYQERPGLRREARPPGLQRQGRLCTAAGETIHIYYMHVIICIVYSGGISTLQSRASGLHSTMQGNSIRTTKRLLRVKQKGLRRSGFPWGEAPKSERAAHESFHACFCAYISTRHTNMQF